MHLNKITAHQIEYLGQTFMRNSARQVELSYDDRVAVAQGILINISSLADLVRESDQSDRSQLLSLVTNVLGYCAKIADESTSTALNALAPEIKEQAEAFQPEMA